MGGGDKPGTVSQMGTLEWVKPALKRAAPSSPTVTLHTSIQAELRAPLAEIQKGQNHSFTLPHSHLCIPRVYILYSTDTRQNNTHSQAQDCSLLVAPWGYIASPSPSAHREQNVDGYCPDAVVISLMLTQMSMGSSDRGLLIPHMNLAPKGGRRRGGVCVANMRELHEGAYITRDLSLALMGVFK